MTPAYYNEHDPFCAQWLRNLMEAGQITPGYVDERSIEDVVPDDLREFDRCHFFAGIGIWDYAMRARGWYRPSTWTGSCPCQPFSAAGKRGGEADERHLWPAFFHLIRVRRPDVVLGEQVSSKIGLGWLELVQADLETEGYAVGAVDTCAAGFAAEGHAGPLGGAHIRQRLYWGGRRLARGDDTGPQGRLERGDGAGQRPAGPGGVVGGLEHSDDRGRGRWEAPPPRYDDDRAAPVRTESHYGLGESSSHRLLGNRPVSDDPRGFVDWLLCRDAKWRPVEARNVTMANAYPGMLGRLRPDLQRETERLIEHAAQRLHTTPDEVMRTLLKHPDAAPGRAAVSIQETEVLLSQMLKHPRLGGGESYSDDGACESRGAEDGVRVLRRDDPAGDSPRQRELAGREAGEFADAVRVLSSAVARVAQEARDQVLYTDAPASFPLSQDVCKNRVGRIRAYGNGLDAAQAQAFVEAWMEACP